MEKQQFIDYCKGKIADLGETTFINYYGEQQTTKVLAVGRVRDFGLVKVIRTEIDSENFTCLNEQNEIVCDTPMLTYLSYIARLEFEKIDKAEYQTILMFWENIKEYFE